MSRNQIHIIQKLILQTQILLNHHVVIPREVLHVQANGFVLIGANLLA